MFWAVRYNINFLVSVGSLGISFKIYISMCAD